MAMVVYNSSLDPSIHIFRELKCFVAVRNRFIIRIQAPCALNRFMSQQLSAEQISNGFITTQVKVEPFERE